MQHFGRLFLGCVTVTLLAAVFGYLGERNSTQNLETVSTNKIITKTAELWPIAYSLKSHRIEFSQKAFLWRTLTFKVFTEQTRGGQQVWKRILIPIITSYGLMLTAFLVSSILASLTFQSRSNLLQLLATVAISTPLFLAGALLLALSAGKFSIVETMSGSLWQNPAVFAYLSILILRFWAALQVYFSTALANYHSGMGIIGAKAKGLSPRQLYLTNTLPIFGISWLPVAASTLPTFLSGAVALEYLLGVPGGGTLLVEAARDGDAPLIAALFMLAGISALLINQLLLKTTSILDPRLE